MLAVDRFTVETISLQRLYVLFFIELGSRRVRLAGCTANPSGPWVAQQARQLAWTIQERPGSCRFLIRDRDSTFTRGFDAVFASEGIRIIKTPVRAPKANASAERFVRTIRAECLDWLLIVNRRHLERVLLVFADHYNAHKPHRSLNLKPPDPVSPKAQGCALTDSPRRAPRSARRTPPRIQPRRLNRFCAPFRLKGSEPLFPVAEGEDDEHACGASAMPPNSWPAPLPSGVAAPSTNRTPATPVMALAICTVREKSLNPGLTWSHCRRPRKREDPRKQAGFSGEFSRWSVANLEDVGQRGASTAKEGQRGPLLHALARPGAYSSVGVCRLPCEASRASGHYAPGLGADYQRLRPKVLFKELTCWICGRPQHRQARSSSTTSSHAHKAVSTSAPTSTQHTDPATHAKARRSLRRSGRSRRRRSSYEP